MPDPSSAPLIGRERELGVLAEQLAAAENGSGRVVLVGGEPGIGKTALLSACAEHARATGATVLLGHAYEAEGLPPYLPFIEALRGYVRSAEPARLRRGLGSGAAQVALLVPELASVLGEFPSTATLQPEHQQYQLFDAVADFLCAVAREAGCGLLLLEDLHWADAPSLQLLLHLARRLAEAPLLVALSYRSTELRRTHPLQQALAELSRLPAVTRLRLAPLPEDAAARLIGSLTGATPLPPVVERIYAETAGNPFFLTEVVLQLVAEGVDLAAPDTGSVSWAVPEGVRQVIGARLARLDADANRLLAAAAVLGDGFRYDELAAMVDAEPAVLLAAFEALLAAGLLVEQGDGFGFSHALIRQALVAELSLPRRQALHLRAAEAIERVHVHNLTPHVAALAGHYLAAGAAADPVRCYGYAKQAAEAAEAVFAWDAAAAHWQTAIDVLDDGGLPAVSTEERLDVLLGLGRALRRSGAREPARAVFRRVVREAGEAGLPQYQAYAALGFAEHYGSGVFDVPMLQTALAAMQPVGGPLYARVLARSLGYGGVPGSNAEKRALADQAVAITVQSGDLLAHYHALAAMRVLQPSPQEQLAAAQQMQRLAQQLGNDELLAEAVRLTVSHLLELGRTDEAEAAMAAYTRFAERLRQPFFRWWPTLWQAMRALREGRLAAVEELAEQALALGEEAGSRNALQFCAEQLTLLRLFEGRAGELHELLDDPRQSRAWVEWGCSKARVLAIEGRLEEARTLFERLAAQEFGAVLQLPEGVLPIPLACLADVCVALGDRARAAVLYELLLPSAGTLTVHVFVAVCEGAVDRRLGLLAGLLERWDAAVEHFEAALRLHERVGARVWLAQTQREYAELLLKRPPRTAQAVDHARALLQTACASYEAMGIEYEAQRTQALLAELTPAPSALRRFPAGLSEREVEVLRLVAAGRTNREIAEALVVSPATVAFHLKSILNKTGAANRTEAATFAHRHGLTVPPA